MTEPHADILVVDDDPDLLDVLVDLLSFHGYRVRATVSGRQAIAAAVAKPPDLILLDVNLPDLDGLAVLEELKSKSQTRDVPVLFLSGTDAGSVKAIGLNDGAVDYMTKPFEIGELLARIRTHVEHYRQRQTEREFLSVTLLDMVRSLTEELSGFDAQQYTKPVALADLVGQVARALSLPGAWEVELAALLSRSGVDSSSVVDSAQVTSTKLCNLPGLDGVARLLAPSGAERDRGDSRQSTEAEVLTWGEILIARLESGEEQEAAFESLKEQGCHSEILREMRRCYRPA